MFPEAEGQMSLFLNTMSLRYPGSIQVYMFTSRTWEEGFGNFQDVRVGGIRPSNRTIIIVKNTDQVLAKYYFM